MSVLSTQERIIISDQHIVRGLVHILTQKIVPKFFNASIQLALSVLILRICLYDLQKLDSLIAKPDLALLIH